MSDLNNFSPRIKEIFEHRHDDYDRNELGVRDYWYSKVFSGSSVKNKAYLVAMGFEQFLAHKKILIKEIDILAGFPFRYTYDITIPIHTPLDYDPRYRAKTNIDFYKEIQDGIESAGLDENSKEAERLRCFAKAGSIWFYKHWPASHVIPYYEKLLKVGFGGLIEEGKRCLEGASPEHRPYIEAMIKCDEAAAAYILRYAEEAEYKKCLATRPIYRNNMEKAEKALRNIAYGSPSSFFEAVQLLWLAHEMLYCENFPSSESFGRLDQYLFPFYKKDLEEGLITEYEAQELIDALWIKFGATLQGYQNIILGGVGNDGITSGYNPITLMAMRASRKFKFEQPLLCLRYNEDMDDEIFDEAIELLKTGTGFPAFFNERELIKAKVAMGVDESEAVEFGTTGCVELSIPGKEYLLAEGLRVNWCKVLEVLLQNGKCLLTSDSFEILNKKNLEDIETFEEFKHIFIDELLHFSELGVEATNFIDKNWVNNYPAPYMSSLFEGCFEKGIDVTGGGTKYNSSALNVCGVANITDSLIAIRKLVFKEKKYTLRDFADACASNFSGYEQLRRDAIDCPKYGNDLDEPDELYAELISTYADYVDTLKNPRGGRYQMGIYSVEDHVKMGVWTGATPDGRLAGQALANGAAPVQGRDTTGPTAVVNSILKTDLSRAHNGMVLDIKLSPSFFDKENHVFALKSLIRTYMSEGGMEIQFNVIDRDTLIEAQKHPENYSELVVRVSGFSAVFTTLIKETQDEIIARTEYATV